MFQVDKIGIDAERAFNRKERMSEAEQSAYDAGWNAACNQLTVGPQLRKKHMSNIEPKLVEIFALGWNMCKRYNPNAKRSSTE